MPLPIRSATTKVPFPAAATARVPRHRERSAPKDGYRTVRSGPLLNDDRRRADRGRSAAGLDGHFRVPGNANDVGPATAQKHDALTPPLPTRPAASYSVPMLGSDARRRSVRAGRAGHGHGAAAHSIGRHGAEPADAPQVREPAAIRPARSV
jgi:hypothetical protein